MENSSFTLPLPNQKAAQAMNYPDPSELPNPDEIEQIVTRISESTFQDKQIHFAEIYPDFAKRFPRIFEMACSHRGNVSHLSFMLDKLRDIKRNQTNQYDASVQVGERLANAYIRPQQNP
jgi:hypothetical protein